MNEQTHTAGALRAAEVIRSVAHVNWRDENAFDVGTQELAEIISRETRDAEMAAELRDNILRWSSSGVTLKDLERVGWLLEKAGVGVELWA